MAVRDGDAGALLTTMLESEEAEVDMEFRRTFLSLADRSDKVSAGIYGVLSLGGAVCIALLGLILFLGSF